MQILNDLLVSLDHPEAVNPVSMDITCRQYKYDTPELQYKTETVHRIEYSMIYQNPCPPQYNDPFVIGFTFPGSNVSWKNMDIYFDVGQHEALHHDPEITALHNHRLEEIATRIKDKMFKWMGYDRRSVPYTATYKTVVNTY